MQVKLQKIATLIMAITSAACGAATTTAQPEILQEMACEARRQYSDPDLQKKIDPIIDAALSRGFAGGVAIMVDGKLVYNRVAGSASLEHDILVTEDTLFHVASITKFFTAALVMKAVEENLIAIDDPIEKFAPNTRLAERGVTFFDLLAHQSGMGSSYAAESETEQGEALAAIDAAPFDPEKVGKFRYSSDGYDLLGILIERAYERPYETLVREKILTPACLDRPKFWGEVDKTDPQLVSQSLSELPSELRNRNYGMLGSAGLMAAAADLALFQNALGQGFVLNEISVEELFAPRGEMSLGSATFGAFLSEAPGDGYKINARGYEDWGDNAILIDYLDKRIILAVVTSRGPAEDTGEPPFRSQISQQIEEIIAAPR